MSLQRRDFAKFLAAAAPAAAVRGAVARKLGIPGAFPGRVAAIEHPGSLANRVFNREAVRAMIGRGMMELTGTPSPVEAWKFFFEPSDVVGLKLNPVGRPGVISSPEVVQEIIAGLRSAGVAARNIIAYDRYQNEFIEAGFDKWLPEGVRWTWATIKINPMQLDMEGYDRDQYVEMPLLLPKADQNDRHYRRSYLSRFISKDINKLVNLSLVKHHQSAGVTGALKNLSHGLVNNVSRSHVTASLNACGTFIPNIVDHSIIRQKTTLNITDGILASWHGGPGTTSQKYTWEHKTMYFSTDPVAIDKLEWRVIDEQRRKVGMLPIADAKPDQDSHFVNMQVEHIEIAASLGLGVFDDKLTDIRRVRL